MQPSKILSLIFLFLIFLAPFVISFFFKDCIFSCYIAKYMTVLSILLGLLGFLGITICAAIKRNKKLLLFNLKSFSLPIFLLASVLYFSSLKEKRLAAEVDKEGYILAKYLLEYYQSNIDDLEVSSGREDTKDEIEKYRTNPRLAPEWYDFLKVSRNFDSYCSEIEECKKLLKKSHADWRLDRGVTMVYPAIDYNRDGKLSWDNIPDFKQEEGNFVVGFSCTDKFGNGRICGWASGLLPIEQIPIN